jgi:hypothetical protein
MLGLFDVKLKPAEGLDDAAFLEAMRRGDIGKVLAGLPTEVHAKAKNQIFDNFAGYTLDHAFSGPQTAYPYYFDSGNAALAHICLTNLDGETDTYTEDWSAYTNLHNMSGSVNGGNAGKRFVEDGITDHEQDSDPDNAGRQSIRYRERWLYLPSQVISNVIRSISIGFHTNADSQGNQETGMIGRVRLKDSQGRKVDISKTSKHVLLVQYEFTLVTV